MLCRSSLSKQAWTTLYACTSGGYKEYKTSLEVGREGVLAYLQINCQDRGASKTAAILLSWFHGMEVDLRKGTDGSIKNSDNVSKSGHSQAVMVSRELALSNNHEQDTYKGDHFSIRPVHPVINVAPLNLVLLASLAKEAFEDWVSKSTETTAK